jgi:ribosome maturation factor RimP
VKVKLFAPVNNSRMWTGRLMGIADGVVKIDVAAVKQKGKAKKAAAVEVLEIALKDVEKANLVVEI